MKELMELKKEELVEMIIDMESVLCYLEEKGGKKFKEGRKEEVLKVLMDKKRVSVKEIGRIVGISERNVSSQMSYLRKDGVKIGTDSLGRKFIEMD